MSSSRLLSDQVALITGASRGIGLEIARTFASHGAALAINARDEALLSKRAEELRDSYNVQVLELPGDVSDAPFVASMFQAIFKTFKRLDVAVNNAGILEDALLGMIPEGVVHRVIDINTKGTLYGLQGAARLMSRGKRGSIINLSSIIGTNGNEGQVVYAASKAAVIGATLAAAKELAPLKIRVNAIAPGYIDTDMIRRVPPEIHERRMAQIGFRELGKPSDVANVALFLASDLSRYVTGQVVGVDGGMRI